MPAIPSTWTVTELSASRSRLEVEMSPQRIVQLLSRMLTDAPPPPPARLPHRKRGRPAPKPVPVLPVPPLRAHSCAYCGELFKTQFSGSRYCSEQCKAKAKVANGHTVSNSAAEGTA